MNFYQEYVRLCNEKGESPTKAAINMGFSKATPNRWKNGGDPTEATIQRIVDYFNLPTTYFDTLNDDQDSSFLASASSSEQSLFSPAELSLLAYYRSTNAHGQSLLLENAEFLAGKYPRTQSVSTPA